MSELREYYQNLVADIRREADASGIFPVEAFFDRMTERLTEAGELEVADRSYYQSGEGGHRLRIDGYAGDPRDSGGVLKRDLARGIEERDVLRKGEFIFRHWSGDNERARTSCANPDEVRLYPGAPRSVWKPRHVSGSASSFLQLLRMAQEPVEPPCAGRHPSDRADPAGVGRQRQGLRVSTARQGIAQQCPERGKLADDLRDQGELIPENRVARLASLAGIAAQVDYRRRPGRHDGKPAMVAENRLEQQFEASRPDQLWVTDITYIKPHEGRLYLCVVIDLFSRVRHCARTDGASMAHRWPLSADMRGQSPAGQWDPRNPA